MNPLKGTALYCGIGVSTDQMERHLEMAASVGINALFTSLQLPEADVEITLRDFPKMAAMAHRYGITVDVDIGARTATRFGIDMYDVRAIKELGVDIARYDTGYKLEQVAELTHNDQDVIIEFSAAKASEDMLACLDELGINKGQSRFCHNYYPMMYTGHTPDEVREINARIHRHGYRVGGFLASQTHRRIACEIGLPTIERQRNMNAFSAAQEAYFLGMDDLFFGDDLADVSELRILAEIDPSVTTFRIEPYVEGDVMDWLLGRTLAQMQDNCNEIIRSSFSHPDSMYPDGYDNGLIRERRNGEITVASSMLWRYSGEVQIARTDLPADPNMGIVGRVIEEDRPLLETFRKGGRRPFRLIRS